MIRRWQTVRTITNFVSLDKTIENAADYMYMSTTDAQKLLRTVRYVKPKNPRIRNARRTAIRCLLLSPWHRTPRDVEVALIRLATLGGLFPQVVRTFAHRLNNLTLLHALGRAGVFWRKSTNRLTHEIKLHPYEKESNRLARLSYIQTLNEYRMLSIIYVFEINYEVQGHQLTVLAAGSLSRVRAVQSFNNMSVEDGFGFLKSAILDWLPESESLVFVFQPNSLFRRIKRVLPSRAAPVEKMREWLDSFNIDYDRTATRTALYELIQRAPKEEDESIMEQFLKDMNHKVFYMPEHHANLNPFEYLWADIQESIVLDNHQFVSMPDILGQIPQDKWLSAVKKVMKLEGEYLTLETYQDRMNKTDAVDCDYYYYLTE